ncbi:MAG: DMT family transporter [Oscillospiraceae bacterium]|nr:DMT family transporter [Oscillospiraceae bacterium]
MRQKYWIFALVTVFFWASASVLLRLTYGSYSAVTLAAARCWIASIILLIVCFVKKMPPPKPRDIPIFFVAGAVGFTFYTTVFNIGFSMVTAATGNVVMSAGPVFAAVLARFFFKERIRPLGWVFTGVSFGGILILMLWNGVLSINIGVLWVLLAAALLSSYNLIQRKLTRSYAPLQCSAYSLAAASVLMIPFLPAAVRDTLTAAPAAVVTLIYLSACSSSVAYLFWSKAFSLAKRTADVTNFLYLPPFIATLLAFVLFHEVPDWGTAVGGAIILFGIWMFQKKA